KNRTDINALYFFQRIIIHFTWDTRADPIKLMIMNNNKLLVLRQLNIKFNSFRTMLPCFFYCRNCIFRGFRKCSSLRTIHYFNQHSSTIANGYTNWGIPPPFDLIILYISLLLKIIMLFMRNSFRCFSFSLYVLTFYHWFLLFL